MNFFLLRCSNCHHSFIFSPNLVLLVAFVVVFNGQLSRYFIDYNICIFLIIYGCILIVLDFYTFFIYTLITFIYYICVC